MNKPSQSLAHLHLSHSSSISDISSYPFPLLPTIKSLVLKISSVCKSDGESVDHLLLHCSYAYNLWSFVFSFLGVSWVMPRRVGELLACWYGGVWCHTTASIWSAIPHCIMWTIWREWNNQTFEGKQSITELKHIFILSLFEWITALSGLRISSLLNFLDLCSFI